MTSDDFIWNCKDMRCYQKQDGNEWIEVDFGGLKDTVERLYEENCQLNKENNQLKRDIKEKEEVIEIYRKFHTVGGER